MRYPKSEHLGHVNGPDGLLYSLHFYGENEGAAVITGPTTGTTRELYREPAVDPDDARRKLAAVLKNPGLEALIRAAP